MVRRPGRKLVEVEIGHIMVEVKERKKEVDVIWLRSKNEDKDGRRIMVEVEERTKVVNVLWSRSKNEDKGVRCR